MLWSLQFCEYKQSFTLDCSDLLHKRPSAQLLAYCLNLYMYMCTQQACHLTSGYAPHFHWNIQVSYLFVCGNAEIFSKLISFAPQEARRINCALV